MKLTRLDHGIPFFHSVALDVIQLNLLRAQLSIYEKYSQGHGNLIKHAQHLITEALSTA